MAVVSQPFDRGTVCKVPGNPDPELNEFWEDDPWEIAFKHNLSCFERHRTFLNLGERKFADISFLSGADCDGDGRSVVAADFRCNGQMDLLVRQPGGGALLYYENNFPKNNYLKGFASRRQEQSSGNRGPADGSYRRSTPGSGTLSSEHIPLPSDQHGPFRTWDKRTNRKADRPLAERRNSGIPRRRGESARRHRRGDWCHRYGDEPLVFGAGEDLVDHLADGIGLGLSVPSSSAWWASSRACGISSL